MPANAEAYHEENIIQTVEGAPTHKKPWADLWLIRIGNTLQFTDRPNGQMELLASQGMTSEEFYDLYGRGETDARKITIANAKPINEHIVAAFDYLFDRIPGPHQLLTADTITLGSVSWPGQKEKDNTMALENTITALREQYSQYVLHYTLPVNHDEERVVEDVNYSDLE